MFEELRPSTGVCGGFVAKFWARSCQDLGRPRSWAGPCDTVIRGIVERGGVVPTEDAVRREREVVELVAAALRSGSAADVEFAGSPDEDRGSGRFPEGLTVDALLHLGRDGAGRTWALDVMGLPWSPLLIPAIKGIEKTLREGLEQLARSADVGLTVGFQPPVGAKDHGLGYVKSVLELTRRYIEGDEDGRVTAHLLAADPGTYVEVDRRPAARGAVHLILALSSTPDIAAQLQADFVPALERKLRKQLLRAHQLGFPTILAIDQIGPDSPVGNNFLASPSVVGQIVSATVIRNLHRGEEHCLDLAVLVGNGTCSPIYGFWPDGVDP